MKKIFKLEDLDCANIDADETRFDEIMDNVVKACRKIEPDCKIVR